MKTLDLRQSPTTLAEALELARSESVLIVNEEGDEFILEAGEAFEREAARLGQSDRFMDFLAERAKEPGTTSLDELERKLAQAEAKDRARGKTR